MKGLITKPLNKGIVALTVFTMPLSVFAQTTTLRDVAGRVIRILGQAIMPLLFSASLTWFIWGVIEFIRNADNPEKRKSGRVKMLWGIVALFVMISFLGITSVFTETLFNSSPILPQLYENA